MTQVIHTQYLYDKIFRVEITGTEVSIFKHCWECLEKCVKDFVIKLENHMCIYIGYDSRHKDDPFYYGNSIIIRVNDKLHIFVGEDVHAFYLEEPILGFSSNLIKGQSFPYIETSSGYYLLLEKVFLSKKKNKDGIDPYDLYYIYEAKGFQEYKFFEMSKNYLLK
jgi:hypothetical protein